MAQQSGDYSLANQANQLNIGAALAAQGGGGIYGTLVGQTLNSFYCHTCCCWQWGFHNCHSTMQTAEQLVAQAKLRIAEVTKKLAEVPALQAELEQLQKIIATENK